MQSTLPSWGCKEGQGRLPAFAQYRFGPAEKSLFECAKGRENHGLTVVDLIHLRWEKTTPKVCFFATIFG